MFKENKYLKSYNNFIQIRKNRVISKTLYYESHHIIPRSLGGSDSEDNLVLLTPREHFFAHLLLLKITQGNAKFKMMHAINLMSGTSFKKKIITSKQYDLARTIYYKILQTAGKEYQEVKTLQDNILAEFTDLDKVFERGTCKTCGIRPKAINYIKNGKTFYRSKCDVCASGKNNFKIPNWMREGYAKKKKCENCGFDASFTEQLTVIGESKNYKTICLNCQMALVIDQKHDKLKPLPDF